MQSSLVINFFYKTKKFTSLALVLFSILNIELKAFTMPINHFPKLQSFEEAPIDRSSENFRECSEAFHEIIGKNININSEEFTYSENWGFIMRTTFHDIGEKGNDLPLTSFICWKKAGQPIGIAIAPVDNS